MSLFYILSGGLEADIQVIKLSLERFELMTAPLDQDITALTTTAAQLAALSQATSNLSAATAVGIAADATVTPPPA
jgi:hypothetical protein